MRNQTRILTVVAATVALAGAAYAADQAVSSPPTVPAAESAAVKDAGKLSKDGAAAFHDLHMTRIAIFNADPAQAKSLIAKAQSELEKAKSDDTTFIEAEADLKQPAAIKKAATTAKPSNEADLKKPVAWLPVDAQLTIDDDFVATPEKAKAVDEANKSLAKGDQKGALEKLKLADVNVSFTLAVVPLQATTNDVDQAAKLIDSGKYYEANSVLKQAEDGLRFDVVDLNDVPKAAPAQHQTDAATTTPAKKVTN